MTNMTDFDQKKRAQVKVTSFKKKERLRLKFYRLVNHALDEISALQNEKEAYRAAIQRSANG